MKPACRRARALAAPAALALLALLGGCERAMRDMYQQPRLDPGEPSTLWPDGKAMRAPVPGTVAYSSGDLAATSSGRRGEEAVTRLAAAEAANAPPPLTPALLRRGRERFDIYCAVCHGPAGDGDGMVVRRGFPAPPTYHQDRLRQAPDRHFYDVITQGHGIMVSYADRVTPEDRWAIVAWIRVLQLSQHAPVAELTPALRAALGPAPAAANASPASSAGSRAASSATAWHEVRP